MASIRYFYGASQEEFPPEELLRQAVAAEQAGFDGISTSDHLQNNSGADPMKAIEVYGEHVLPAVRGSRV